MNKKILSIGTIAVSATPVALAVSCGDNGNNIMTIRTNATPTLHLQGGKVYRQNASNILGDATTNNGVLTLNGDGIYSYQASLLNTQNIEYKEIKYINEIIVPPVVTTRIGEFEDITKTMHGIFNMQIVHIWGSSQIKIESTDSDLEIMGNKVKSSIAGEHDIIVKYPIDDNGTLASKNLKIYSINKKDAHIDHMIFNKDSINTRVPSSSSVWSTSGVLYGISKDLDPITDVIGVASIGGEATRSYANFDHLDTNAAISGVELDPRLDDTLEFNFWTPRMAKLTGIWVRTYWKNADGKIINISLTDGYENFKEDGFHKKILNIAKQSSDYKLSQSKFKLSHIKVIQSTEGISNGKIISTTDNADVTQIQSPVMYFVNLKGNTKF